MTADMPDATAGSPAQADGKGAPGDVRSGVQR
jgi:hypothetical protein